MMSPSTATSNQAMRCLGPAGCLVLLSAAWIVGCSGPNRSERDGPVRAISQHLQELGDMAQARVRHTATLLTDGTVLVAGGASETEPPGLGKDALASAEL